MQFPSLLVNCQYLYIHWSDVLPDTVIAHTVLYFRCNWCMLGSFRMWAFFSFLYIAFQESVICQTWCRTWFLFAHPALPCCLLWGTTSVLCVSSSSQCVCISILSLVRDQGHGIKSKYSLVQQPLLLVGPWAVPGIWGEETNTSVGLNTSPLAPLALSQRTGLGE